MLPIVKINGSLDILNNVRCRPNDVHFSWSFEDFESVNFQNLKFDLRINSTSGNQGTDNFIGARFNLSGFSASIGSYILNSSLPFNRNLNYFGQVRFFDESKTSTWVTFTLKINSAPFTIDARYVNTVFRKDQDIVIDFDKSREDIEVDIKWFRNGALQSNLQNSKIVPLNRISYNDIWYCQLTAFDDLETGFSVSLPSVEIKADTPVVNYLSILPSIATEDDILEASYSLIKSGTTESILNDASKIDWFVNDIRIDQVQNQKFVRLNLSESDQVYFEIKPENFENFGDIVKSGTKIIQSAGYFIFDLSVDGKVNDITVSSDQPVIRWSIKKPGNKDPKYIQILVGTRDGANDVDSVILEYSQDNYTIPANVLKPGARYFVSVSASLDKNNFRNFGKISFYSSGSFWKENVVNSIGYTLLFKLKSHTFGSEPNYTAGYSIQVSDGKCYFEVIEYLDKTVIIFSTSQKHEFFNDNTKYHELIIGVKNERIFIFVDSIKKYDNASLQSSSIDKFIKLRSRPDGDKEISLEIEKLNINIDGIFEPGVSRIYAAQSFEEKAYFLDGDISSITSKENHFILSVNPFNSRESSKLYKFIPDQEFFTFSPGSSQNQSEEETSENFIFNSVEKINGIDMISIAHSRGLSVLSDLPVFAWDIHTSGNSIVDLKKDRWELKTNRPGAFYLSDGAFEFNTSFNLNGKVSNTVLNGAFAAIRIEKNSFFNIVDYSASLTNEVFSLRLPAPGGDYLECIDISMSNKNIDVFIDELKNFNISSDPAQNIPFGVFYDIFGLDEFSSAMCSGIMEFGLTDIDDSLELLIGSSSEILDPYAANTYSSINNSYSYISQSTTGDPWNMYASNDNGYVVNFDVQSVISEDSINPNVLTNDGSFGMHINDGKYKLKIDTLLNSLIINNKQKVSKDLSSFSSFHLSVKDGLYKLWSMELGLWDLISDGEMDVANTTGIDKSNLSCHSRSGLKVVMWEESTPDGKVLRWSNKNKDGEWSNSNIFIDSSYYPSKPSLTIDSFGNIHMVFEMFSNSKSDIGYSIYKDNKWSTPVKIVDQSGSSADPKILCDEYNNMYVSWIDKKFGKSDVFWCSYNYSQSRWSSSGFGGNDFQVSNSEVSVSNIDHAYKGGNYFVTWSEKSIFGKKKIKLAKYNAGSKQWYSSTSSGTDFDVSPSDSRQADYPSICVDFDNNIHIVWQDVLSGFNRIYYRMVGSNLSANSPPKIITSVNYQFDCTTPRLSVIDDITDPYTSKNGDVVLLFNKSQNSSIDPYTEEVNYTSYGNAIQGIYTARWSRDLKAWLSSGSKIGTEGGYDSVLKVPSTRYVNSIVSPKSIEDIQDIFYLGIDSGDMGFPISVFNLRYDLGFVNGEYRADIDSYTNFDPDEIITSNKQTKSIVFGSSSNSICGKLRLKNIKLSFTESRNPFKISLVSSVNTNMPDKNYQYARVNSFGDIWAKTIKNLIFVSQRNRTVFDMTDSQNDNITHFVSSSNFNDESKIDSLFFDSLGNIFVNVNKNILVSNDHFRFFKLLASNDTLKGHLDSKFHIIRQFNNHIVFVNDSYILFIKNYNTNILSKIPYEDHTEDDNIFSIELTGTDYVKYLLTSFDSNANKVYDVSADSNYFWVSTNMGIYQIDNNLSSNSYAQQFNDFINISSPAVSINCVDSNLRFFATSNKIFISSGSSIRPIDTIARYVGIQGSDRDFLQDAELFNINDIKQIKLIDSKNMLVVSPNYIYRLIFRDIYSYQTEFIQLFDMNNLGLNFVSQVETNSGASQSTTLSRQKFNFTPTPDDGEGPYYSEIYLNKHRINNGYRISTKYGLLYFEDKILPTDEIFIKVRKDIRLYNDYTQNKAEVQAFGAKTFNVENLITQNNSIYSVITDGVIDSITTRNELIRMPYDEVVIDKNPPSAKLKYIEQVGPTTIKLKFLKLTDSNNEEIDFDSVSGVKTMSISNFDNFTSDGVTSLVPETFKEEFLFDINLNAVGGSFLKLLPTNVTGRSGNYFRRTSDNVMLTLIGSAYPARIYYMNSNSVFEDNFVSLDEEPDSRVEFIYRLNNSLVVGVSKDNGRAKLFISQDGSLFQVIATLDSNGVSHPFFSEYSRKLYFGTYKINGTSSGSLSGYLYSFDGISISTIISGLDDGITCVTGFDRFIEFGTQSMLLDSHIYRISLSGLSSPAIIVHSDTIKTSSITSKGTAVYAGMSSSGRIIRSLNVDIPFIVSFRTFDAEISRMVTLQVGLSKRIFAAVGQSIYSLQGTWNLKGRSQSPIRDIFQDDNNNIVYISEGSIQKIIENTTTNKIDIFARLTDNAGNQTDITSVPDENEDGYNDNLIVTLSPDSGNDFDFSSFSLSNSIIELDKDTGSKIRVIPGDNSFYSADKIMVEVGTYETEIFNATSGHISWGNISWEVTQPDNTSVYFEVRSGRSKIELSSSEYQIAISSERSPFDLSFLTGQYIQVRIVLRSASDFGLAPSVRSLNIVSLGSSSSEIFTVNFSLPSRVKRGILTSQKQLSFGSSILFGINTLDDTNFANYQIIPENRIFTTDDNQYGKDLRIGVRILTSQIIGQTANPIPVTDPYASGIFANALLWSYQNEEQQAISVDFKIEVYSDSDPTQEEAPLFTVSAVSNPNYFKVDGEAYPTGSSVTILPGKTKYFSFIPYGLPLECDEKYYCRILIVSSPDDIEVEHNVLLVKQCGTNFFNTITFDFVNELDFANFHFRIRMFGNEARTDLIYSFFSQIDTNNWTKNGLAFPSNGIPLAAGEQATVEFEPNAEQFELEINKKYHLSIEAFDGEVFSWSNNSYIYQVSQSGSGPSCGLLENVPILRSFSMMFELENGEMIKIRLDN